MSSQNSMSPAARNAVIAGAIILSLFLIIGVGWSIQSHRDATGAKGKVPGESSSSGASDASTPAEKGGPALTETFGLGIGDPDAPVKVEVFEDFQCPFCMMFEQASRETLRKAAEDGDAYIVYRPMAFINDYSSGALNAFGVVLDAEGGEVALKFHDLLFENQPSESGPWPSDDQMVQLAVQAGAKEGDVRSGIEKDEFGQWVLNATDAASKRKVNSTPTIFVNGKQVAGTSIEDLLAKTVAAINAG